MTQWHGQRQCHRASSTQVRPSALHVPLTIRPSPNDPLQVRELRSQLAQQAEHAREATNGPSPEAVAEMQVCAGSWLCNSVYLASCQCGVQCLISLELGEQIGLRAV